MGSSAFTSGTSAAYLDDQPLPRAARDRPLVFVLGPAGCGKTVVARRLAGVGAAEVDAAGLARAVSDRVRTRGWPDALDSTAALILDGPAFLERRPGFAQHVAGLLAQRVEVGLRTVVTEPADGSTMRALLDAVPVAQRATVLLRFPVGRGRRRVATRICEDLGLDRALARQTVALEPWSYRAVRAHLLALSA